VQTIIKPLDIKGIAMRNQKRVVIVGAGFTGLYLARELRKTSMDTSITIFESSKNIGGKCVTLEYGERGPWRIHSSHSKIIKLVTELGLETEHNQPYDKKSITQINKYKETKDAAHQEMGRNLGYLSIHDEHYWNKSPLVSSGYPGLEAQASAPGIAKPTYSAEGGQYHHIIGGMTALIEKLTEEVQELGVSICTEHFLREIFRGRRLRFLVKGTSRKDFRYDRLYLCIPVHHLKELEFPGKKLLRPLFAAVEPYSLNHCYYSGEKQPRKQKITKDGQWIPPQQPGNWSQMYTGGEYARTWNRARYHHSKNILAYCGEAKDYRMHFWPYATYTWRPSPVFTQEPSDIDKKCMFPLLFLGIVILSESLTRNQGWLEGSCENVVQCSRYLSENHGSEPIRNMEVVKVGAYRIPWDRIANVWFKLHPGGQGALEKYRQCKRWDHILERIPHSDEAWSHAFHLACVP
jgi:hypothetical protein